VNLKPYQIETLRAAVGWNPLTGKYQTALENSFAHYTMTDQQELIAFARVISDGAIYALIVDVMIHPAFQSRGIGSSFVNFILEDLKLENIRSANVIFEPKLEKFYQKLGFEVLMAGTMRNH
jgi:N-acetylglutamate synthase-like GNAT family acetyltransferase